MPVLHATHTARLAILQLALPGAEAVNAGVLLEDPATDRLYVRLRRDWDALDAEEAEVLESVESDLAAQAARVGAAAVFEHLEDTLSNLLRVSARREAIVEDFDRALARLYRENVRSTPREFVTHLPRYSPAIAAGRFLDNAEAAIEDWVEAPPGLRIAPEMFVARIQGRSMEPSIPDQSLCVFRAGVAGSRNGRMLLVEDRQAGPDERHTVKRYRSTKRQTSEGWEHESIRLEPLNPEFPVLDLDPEADRFRIIAEFVAVLD